MKKNLFIILPLFYYSVAFAQQKSSPTVAIALNQIGFYPSAEKVAIVQGAGAQTFYISTGDLTQRLFEGKLEAPVKSLFSDKQTQAANFTAFKKTGTYVVVVEGVGYSYPFEIKDGVYNDVAKASIKAFYFHRLSTPLPEKNAGKWQRKAGHPDNEVIIHASAVSSQRMEGSKISSPRGWYDAGDYNKYIVNSGITMGTLMSAYEDYPEYFKKLELNIPESGNEVPDLLDEVLWNLRWMLSMQDPEDGGVYHKLTNPNFDKMVMPDQAVAPRYVVQKSTAAALDFAAVLAQASRVYKNYNKQFPGLADSCFSQAEKAWQWAVKNPDVKYDQNELNKKFSPAINTGAYGDNKLSDEFVWAACELYACTKRSDYLSHITSSLDKPITLPSWNEVQLLGYFTLLRKESELPALKTQIQDLKKSIVGYADNLAQGVEQRAYKTVMGKTEKDFIWGSSAVAANQSIVLIQAYRISSNTKYKNYAASNVDYLLGRNATGYSFVTGFGDKTPMHPHHRPSEADGIAEPVPGFLSGGPNPFMQDKCTTYTSRVADEAFTDDVCSYASNEVAINWNAPLVYLLNAFEALQKK
jgi:endoglucanase